MPDRSPESGRMSNEGTQKLLEELQRYAGWLGKDERSLRLRASVKSLGLAIASDREVPSAILSVEANIQRLGSGAIVPLLRSTVRKILAERAGPPPTHRLSSLGE